jgi:hypothetical protein
VKPPNQDGLTRACQQSTGATGFIILVCVVISANPGLAQLVFELAAFPDSILVSCCVSRHGRGENHPARLEQAL